MGRAVIVGGGEIGNYSRARSFLKEGDYLVYCDSGLRHEEKLGKADLIVGDFDSFPPGERKCEVISLPEKKDDTDTIYGVKEAYSRGFRDFLLLGFTGRRMDHTLANIYVLDYLAQKGAAAKVVDDWCEMETVGKEWKEIPSSFPYFSLIAWKGKVEGVDIENALYPLSSAEVESSWQYCVSNEPLYPGARGRVRKGSMLLVKIFDDDKERRLGD